MESTYRNINHEGRGQDRLSSLPDDILTEIISRLSITSAISTSVLSHRWRHLWTGVTRIQFRTTPSTHRLSNILRHLTSPKLDVFKLEVLHHKHDYSKELQSCIRDNCRRNVQQVISDVLFPIPDCLLNCRSIVVLDLCGPFKREDVYEAVDIQLPNLKKLSLRFLNYLPPWLHSLHKSSPLLEDLTLRATKQPLNAMPSMNIFFPNLKSLVLGLFPYHVNSTPGVYPDFSIDAPQLTNLVTYGCVLPYRFCTNPTKLVKARIDLLMRKYTGFEGNSDELELHRFSEFFKGMSSIRKLELVVKKWQMNIFT
ncbi:FBD-associated F-box protein At4g10400-like [Chenopodium quinoa]|uniref:F-box domain-containing protein n=1 Tax=Chenopodium quinoa TaxID=63459 RepID=A0A803LB22_CHEQI|nr:FBD-associated F-box protein At4g10400-like [Chenopodium quinoa]